MRAFLMLLGLIMLFTGCDPDAPRSGTDPQELWRSAGIHDYTIDQTRSCFCIDGGEPVRTTVRSDTIAGIVRTADNSPVQLPSRAYYLTIDSLFGIIHSPHGDSLVITYDRRLGYPERLDINPQLHPVDGGVLYVTTNLRLP